jgi:histone H3/H4
MDRLPALSADELIERAREPFERLMRQVTAAVNAAPEGRVIRDSEEQVRDLLGEFRQTVYETALQMRVDAAEAAFSPGGPTDGALSAGQGPRRARSADGQRAGADSA